MALVANFIGPVEAIRRTGTHALALVKEASLGGGRYY